MEYLESQSQKLESEKNLLRQAQGKPQNFGQQERTQLELALLKPKGFFIDRDGSPQLQGEFEKAQLFAPPYSEWFTAGYENYPLNKKIIRKLKKRLDGVSIEVFAGTWCKDTRDTLPGFLKIMNEIGQIPRLTAVDRTKTLRTAIRGRKNVSVVPTFVFYRDGREIGKMEESPVESLQEDILWILS